MNNILSDLEYKIMKDQENTKNAKELYEVLSTYNAYSILFLKARNEYEGNKINIRQYYSDSNCYKAQIEDLFSVFKSDECLMMDQISRINDQDILFLVDKSTLLRINSFDIFNSYIGGLSSVSYEFLKIHNCEFKIYKQSVYFSDPYYYDYHWLDKDAIGLFYDEKLISPAYAICDNLRKYNNMDIREILNVLSLDEIYEKITIAKDNKAKKLVLTK